MSLGIVATADDARALTDRIKVAVEGVWHLIEQAYTTRAWSALGYASWDDYCTREFGTSRLRLPREERQEVVASLRQSGLSLRAISSATGESKSQIQRDLEATVPEGTVRDLPTRIVGTDGIERPATVKVTETTKTEYVDTATGEITAQPKVTPRVNVPKTVQAALAH